MRRCDACHVEAGAKPWKRRLAVVGMLFFCPLHLPMTVSGFVVLASLVGAPVGAAWLRPLIFGVSGLAFVYFLLALLRMARRRREFEATHEGHGAASNA